jgi:hypothetical protein
MYFFLSEPQPPHGRRVTTTVTPRRPARKAKIQNQKPQRPAHQRSHAAFTHPHRWPFQRQAWWALWHPNLTRSLSCSHFSTDPTCARERWLRICSAFAHAHPHAAAHSLMPHEAGHMPRRYINIQTRKQALPSWLQRPPEMPAGCIKQVHCCSTNHRFRLAKPGPPLPYFARHVPPAVARARALRLDDHSPPRISFSRLPCSPWAGSF